MNKLLILAGLLVLYSIVNSASGQTKLSSNENGRETAFCITQEELILYNLVNDLRRQNKLPVISLSKSMCLVSKTHINDLLTWKPQQQDCGLHSWSSHGNWKPCCYNTDPLGGKSMNSKPMEITGYAGLGFELVYWEEETATAYKAFDLWKEVEASKEMILNQGKWQTRTWKALGVSIKDGLALIWLGDTPDLAADIYICGMDTLVQSKNLVAEKTFVKPAVNTQQTQKFLAVKPSADKSENKGIKEGELESNRLIPVGNHYFIIVASLKTENQAKEKLSELSAKGYKDAILLPSDERFRISIGSYADERSAKQKLNELRAAFPDCWLFRK